MKETSRARSILTFVEFGVLVILLAIPFHAILTVWASTIVGHYTALRLWSETLVVLLVFAEVIIIATDKKLWQGIKNSPLSWLIVGYSVFTVLVGLIAYSRHTVDLKALLYALDINLRLPIFFGVCMVVGTKSGYIRNHWKQIILIPGLIVVVFGLLQHYILPADFLHHFGYAAQTIPAYETVDQNNNYVRLQSTLRGPNPLGTYLIVLGTALAVLLISAKDLLKRGLILLYGLGAFIVLFFSYSRSALAGAVVSVGLSSWFTMFKSSLRWVVAAVMALIIVGGGFSYIALRHNLSFEDTFLHTSTQTHSPKSSDQNHESAVESGLKDIVHQPLGRGPGTAGPASFYNNHPVRIAEDYYIQLGQEIGVIGAGLFILINIVIGITLWRNREDQLSLVLLCSLVGISLVNLLSLAWTDNTIAYIWWGMAGVAAGPAILKAKELSTHEKKKVQKVKTS